MSHQHGNLAIFAFKFSRKKYSKYQSVRDQFRFFLHNPLGNNCLRQVQLQPRRLRLRSKYLFTIFFFFSIRLGHDKSWQAIRFIRCYVIASSSAKLEKRPQIAADCSWALFAGHPACTRFWPISAQISCTYVYIYNSYTYIARTGKEVSV